MVLVENVRKVNITFAHQIGKFHLKLTINSKELKKKKRIESTKVIYSLLDKEMKKFIHSIQILIY